MEILKNFLSIVGTVLVFGILIFIHEFGHFAVARLCGVGVEEFAIGMGPTVFSKESKKSKIKYSIRALPIGGYVSMIGEEGESADDRAFCNKSVFKRMLIVLAGPAMNLLLGVLLVSIIVLSQQVFISTEIGGFAENAVSNEKLKVGDVIVAVDGVPVFTGNDAAYEIMNQGYEPIDIKIKRDGKTYIAKDVCFGSFEDTGVSFGECDVLFKTEKGTFPVIAKNIFFRSLSAVKMITDSIVSLLTGRFGLDAVSGPIGVVETVSKVGDVNVIYYLYLSALLSVNLGVFNLIPFPALDGGRFAFLLVEAIRRKPLNKKVETYVNFIGIAILFGLMIFIMGKDILNLFRR